MSLRKDIEDVINKHCRENRSGTPDYLLAGFLVGCLRAFETTTVCRDAWYGHERAQQNTTEPCDPPEAE